MHKIIFIILTIPYFLSSCGGNKTKEIIEHPLYLAIDSIIAKHDPNKEFNGIIGIATLDTNICYLQGFRDPVKRKTKLTEDDLFHIASVTKSFTGLAVLKLMNEYELEPSDFIGTYFPELSIEVQKITIQELANHTNGLHDYYSLIESADKIENSEILEILSEVETPVFDAGSEWGYSNSGYVLLALLIERVSGMTYENYLRSRVIEPLEIKNLLVRPKNKDVLVGFNNGLKNEEFSNSTGDAGIYMSMNDLFQYAKTQDQFKLYYNRAKDLSSPWHDDRWTYGFGWYFYEDPIGVFRAHSGRTEGFESYLRVYPEKNLMLCLLSNHEDPKSKIIREEIIQYLIENKDKLDA